MSAWLVGRSNDSRGQWVAVMTGCFVERMCHHTMSIDVDEGCADLTGLFDWVAR